MKTKEEIKIILASQSPRRKELLSLMGLAFDAIPSEKDEDMHQKTSIKKMSISIANQKSEDIFAKTQGDRVVIGSDTMVYLKGKIFGKPKNQEEAFIMLKALSNSWHKVITSLSVIISRNGIKKVYNTYEISKVKFTKLSDEMIKDYLKIDEYKDKAGAYAIQGRSAMFIEKVKGSMPAVMGLPTCKLFKILHSENIL